MNESEDIPSMEALPKPAKLIRKLICDLICIGTLGLLILIFYIAGSPYKRGFNCEDESIRYPYKDNTITSFSLYLYSFLIPITIICSNEFIILRKFSRYHMSFITANFLQIFSWQIYCKLVPFLFAAGSSQLMTDIAKYSIGRLRPHFIDLCHPKLPDGQIIDRFTKCDHFMGYYDEYECSNDRFTKHQIRDSHLSFMSGHSSFAAVCLVYSIFYIENRVRWRTIGLIKQLIQALIVCLIVYTGFSRISDYKHHWSDVLIGLLQGTTVACLVGCFVSGLRKPVRYFRSPSNSDNGSPNSIRPNDREMC